MERGFEMTIQEHYMRTDVLRGDNTFWNSSLADEVIVTAVIEKMKRFAWVRNILKMMEQRRDMVEMTQLQSAGAHLYNKNSQPLPVFSVAPSMVSVQGDHRALSFELQIETRCGTDRIFDPIKRIAKWFWIIKTCVAVSAKGVKVTSKSVWPGGAYKHDETY